MGLLVVMPVKDSRRAKRLARQLALDDILADKDIIVVTPNAVARLREIPGTIVRPALREGKLRYARA